MAMNRTEQTEPVLTKLALAAGVVSLAAGIAGAVSLLAVMTLLVELAGGTVLYLLGGVVLMGVVIVAGVQLLARRLWAQRFLLIFWLACGVAGGVALLAVTLWPDTAALGGGVLWSLVQGGAAVLVAAVMTTLLVLSAARGTRARYGSYVAVSVGVALTLTAAVNMIAQRDYYRRDLETLGRYGLSDRTRRILTKVSDPLRVTLVYTASDEPTVDKYRPRTLEYLQEVAEQMRRHNRPVEIVNADDDADKARVVRRLREQLAVRAAPQERFLADFAERSGPLLAELEAARQRWQTLQVSEFFNQWGLAREQVSMLDTQHEQIADAAEDVREALGATEIPDYAGLIDRTTEALSSARDRLQAGSERVAEFADIPSALADSGEHVDAATAKPREALDALLASLQTPDGQTPAETLKAFIAQAETSASLADAAAEQVANLAGEDNARQLLVADAMLVRIQSTVAPATEIYRLFADEVRSEARRAESILEAARPEYQRQWIDGMRDSLNRYRELFATVGKVVADAVATLSTVNEQTAATLADAGDADGLFPAARRTLDELLTGAETLDDVEPAVSGAAISGDNVVIVEVLDPDRPQVRAIGFDEIWPLASPVAAPAAGDDAPAPERNFDGDSAIGSALRAMTQPPAARVVFTHFNPAGGRQSPRMPRAELAPDNLTALRQRLQEANFQTAEWNLATDDAPPTGDPNQPLPDVLLILPPPPDFGAMLGGPQGEGFGPEDRKRVVDAIDKGTAAIFLCSYMPPMQFSPMMPALPREYAWRGYLRDAWRIDARVDHLVIPAIRSDQRPDEYMIDPIRFGYFPLSAFTEHPIGRPLRGQRMLWRNLCPLRRIEPDTNAAPATGPARPRTTIETVLRVPERMDSVWATSDLQRLIAQIQAGREGAISPGPGDVFGPIPVAIAAAREQTDTLAPTRIAVLAVGSSLSDEYVTEPVPQLGPRGGMLLTDPPRANAEVVVNSSLWLVGLEDDIAAGPVEIESIDEVSPTLMRVLWTLCVVVLPAAIAALGGLVWLARRS